MKIRQASNEEVTSIIEKEPHSMLCTGENSFTLIAVDGNEQNIGVLSAFCREITAPLNGETECFINVISVNESEHGKGIGSALVQEALKKAKEIGVIQVRAYCDINNKASHILWLKNGFGISPVKMPNGQILGSFVTYRIV